MKMKNSDRKESKYLYFSPEITRVEMDTNISLALASDPPFGPDELYVQNQQDKLPVYIH